MMMLIAWISTALAMTPGGFRHDTAAAQDGWRVRDVLIYTPDVEIINQITPRVAKVFGAYGLEAELATTMVTGPGGDAYWGLGNLRTAHSWIIAKEGGATHRIGAEVLVPVSPTHWRSQAFGSSAQDTLATTMGQLVYRLSSGGDAPSEFRVSGGVMQVPSWTTEQQVVFEVAYVHLLPITDKTGALFEIDFALPDQAVLNLRPLVRFELDGGALDVGAQLPLGHLVTDTWDSSTDGCGFCSVQLLTQYRGGF